MLNDITLGQYFPGDSAIHRMDPRMKLILTILYIVGVFCVGNLPGYAIALLFLYIVVRISGIKFSYLLKGIKPLRFIIIFTFVLNLFFVQGETPLFTLGFFTLTREALHNAVYFALRLVFLVMGTSVLTLTTSPVQLTDGLQQIGASAFTGCTALKVLELPDTVTTLGDNVFENCTALASVLLSGGLTALPTYAFRNCTALTGVVVPDSVATFNPGAFADCKALTEVYIGSQSTRYVQLGNNRTHVFARCPALTVYTMAGSDAAVYAKTRNIPTKLYTDADAFADLCAMKRDIYAGYLGFCTDGHGDIQWLTVYAADCTHDGYAIGVCEYCSAILEERHTTATGHNYVVSETPAADGRDGVRITTCQNCGDSSYTVLPGSGTAVEETHTVTGTVVLAADRAATKGTHAAIGADILLNGYTLATTDEKGNFSLQLKSGTYALTVRYAYGFSRTLYVVVSDRDLQCGSVPVIGCDWNKDGKIDDQDYYMFKLIFGTHQGQAGYLSYVDMNHDGMINTRDMIFVERCMGLQAGSFAYTPLVIR